MTDRKDSSDKTAVGTSQPRPPTSSQLRDDIDSGKTQDKVAHSDPAAAPLGTDDEASGASPSADQISTARRHETGRDVPDPSPADQAPEQIGMAPKARYIWLIVAAVVLCALVGVALSL